MSELHIACAKGLKNAVSRLLNQGHDINEKDENGSSPLELALINNNIDIAELLLSDKQIEIDGLLAQTIFEHLDFISKKNIATNNRILAECYNHLGDSQSAEADYDFMTCCYEAAYENIKKIANLNPYTLNLTIEILLNLANSHQANNRLEDAKNKCKLAHALANSRATKDQIYLKQLKDILLKMVEINIISEDIKAAISHLDQLASLQKELNDTATATIPTLLEIAKLYSEVEDCDNALKYYNQIIDICQNETKSDLLLIQAATTQLRIGDIYSKKIGKRNSAKACYQSVIETILQIEHALDVKTIRLARSSYLQWLQLYIGNEPGFDFCSTANDVLKNNGDEVLENFIALHGFITDGNNSHLAKPFYQPFRDFLKLLLKIYNHSTINASVRTYLNNENNREDLLASIKQLEESNVLSLEKIIGSGTAPLLSLATDVVQIKAALNDNGLFSKKRTAENSDEKRESKKQKPDPY